MDFDLSVVGLVVDVGTLEIDASTLGHESREMAAVERRPLLVDCLLAQIPRRMLPAGLLSRNGSVKSAEKNLSSPTNGLPKSSRIMISQYISMGQSVRSGQMKTCQSASSSTRPWKTPTFVAMPWSRVWPG
jgi:hypothetical protein